MEPRSRNYSTKSQRTFLELGEKYAGYCLDGKLTEEMIVKFQSIREVLYECYRVLVNRKELTPIENLSEPEKMELWNECKKFCESLSAPDRIKFVKSYQALAGLMRKRDI